MVEGIGSRAWVKNLNATEWRKCWLSFRCRIGHAREGVAVTDDRGPCVQVLAKAPGTRDRAHVAES